MKLPDTNLEIVTVIPCTPAAMGPWLVAFRCETEHGHQTPGLRFEPVICWAHVRALELGDANAPPTSPTFKPRMVDALVAIVLRANGQPGVANEDPDYVAIVPPGTQLQVWAAIQNARDAGTAPVPLKRIGRGRG